jgi:glycosyltransferase involved in cell wall biosynthesis
VNQLRRAWRVLRDQGAHFVVQKVVVRVFPHVLARPSALHLEDALAVDWRTPRAWASAPAVVTREKLTVAWVMSPPGANSGGHQNIFRFMKFLEDAGHEVRVYLYSAIDPHTPQESAAMVSASSSYPNLRATIERYPDAGMPDDVDAIFATDWPTAYRSFRDASRARRFYFVQDFEPLFYPMGTEAVLAENTYRFGFFGITAGGWLAEKLARDYGMRTASFDFASDGGHYRLENRGDRRDVFFYARPETPRRGFELGIMALDLFARQRPDSRIVLAGQDVRRLRIPFPHENPGNVQVDELNALYNRCAAGLVLSLSNLSLLPLELLSAGVIPVVNDGENNRLVSDNPFIEYTEPIPQALADRLVSIVDRPDRAAHAARAAESVDISGWARSGEQFLEAFERGMRG